MERQVGGTRMGQCQIWDWGRFKKRRAFWAKSNWAIREVMIQLQGCVSCTVPQNLSVHAAWLLVLSCGSGLTTIAPGNLTWELNSIRNFFKVLYMREPRLGFNVLCYLLSVKQWTAERWLNRRVWCNAYWLTGRRGWPNHSDSLGISVAEHFFFPVFGKGPYQNRNILVGYFFSTTEQTT